MLTPHKFKRCSHVRCLCGASECVSVEDSQYNCQCNATPHRLTHTHTHSKCHIDVMTEEYCCIITTEYKFGSPDSSHHFSCAILLLLRLSILYVYIQMLWNCFISMFKMLESIGCLISAMTSINLPPSRPLLNARSTIKTMTVHRQSFGRPFLREKKTAYPLTCVGTELIIIL